jgi:hypothetical protein
MNELGLSRIVKWSGAVMLLLGACNAFGGKLGAPIVFTGTCDASAALGLADDLFVVANDEDNVLRFYRLRQPGPPVQTYDLKSVFTSKRKAPEADLEGVAQLGDQVFFITSHGRNASGKPAPNRHQFFALKLTEANGVATINAVGQSYNNLVADLARDPKYQSFDLADAAGLAPKAPGGFNIEALTATPQGTLLIGFRSPIPEHRALLAPLLNPTAVIAGAPAEFGEPILLNLGGLGLRGITAVTNGYYLLAGPAAGGGQSRLYFWEGGTMPPRQISEVDFVQSNPEGICYLPAGEQAGFLIVSDDGTRMIGGKECKTLPAAQRQFRAYRYVP